MRRPQFNIGGLMRVVLLMAIGLYVFRNLPKQWLSPAECFAIGLNVAGKWASLLSVIPVGLNFAAILWALASRGRVRAVATGYAAFGCIIGIMLSHYDKYALSFSANYIVTPSVYTWITQKSGIYNSPVTFARYILALHSLSIIMAGLVGGLLAGWLNGRPRSVTRPANIISGDTGSVTG